MADIQSNIRVNIETSGALASIKALQRQISAFHVAMSQGGAAANAESAKLQQNLINSLNATGNYRASIQKISSTTESFTTALEKNKLSMGEYFRYAGGASKSFGRLFQAEMQTIEKVAISRVKTLQTQYIKLGRDANGALKAIAVRPVALDMKNLGTQTAMAAQKQQLLNQLLKQGSTNLLNFGKNTQWAGRQLMVGFTIPLATLGMAATKTFRQMEEQAIKFKRVYGDTFTATEETDKMLKQIQNLATEFTKYGVAVADTMEMAAQAAASGKVGADLLAQVTSATRLAVLGNVEQQKALETTISLTDAFGTATEDLGKKINFLNAVENQTVTSIDDLTTAIPKAAPVIKQLGGDVEDLAFFLTAMKEGGVNASEGANALKSGLASLINPTGKASKMLQGFGVDITKIVESNKGDVSKLVVDFAKALDTLDPLSRARAIEQMFGKFQFARMSTLFKNVIQEGSQASTVLDLMKQSSVGLAALSQKELRQIQSSPLYKFQKAIEDFKKELAPVGEEFMKAVTPLINFGRDVLANFNKLEPGMKQFIVNFTGIVAGLGPVFLMTFGLIANGVANVIKGFAFVKNTINRVSSSSTVLGETTHFMTQEQLKAAAVAASLEQSHTKLTQAFTVERKALELLTSAYTKATVEQARFGPTPGKRTPRKKYASGVLSVPGPKGAGDIVPAMLAPGEAVIPAKMATKYSGFINGMISGNVPGFEKGRFALHRAHLQGKLNPNDPKIRQQIEQKFPGFFDLTPEQQERIFFSGSLTADLPSTINQGLKKGVAYEEFVQAWTDRTGKLRGTASMGGLDISNPASDAALQSIEDSILKEVTKISKGGKVTDEILSTATSRVITAKAKDSKEVARAKDILRQRAETVGDLRTDYKKEEYQAALKSGSMEQRGTKIYARDTKGNSTKIKLGAIKDASKGRPRPGQSTHYARNGYGDQPFLSTPSGGTQANKATTEEKKERQKSTNTRKKNNKAVEENTEAIKKDTKSKKKATETDEQRRKRAHALLEKGKAEVASGQRGKLTRDQQRAENYLKYGSYNPTQAEIDAVDNPKPPRKPRVSKAQKQAEMKSQARKATNMRLYGQEEDPSPQQVVAARKQRTEDRKRKVRAARKKAKPRMFSRAAGSARAAKVGKFTGGMRGIGIGSAISIGGSMLASTIPDPGIASAVGGASMVAGLLPMFPALTAGIAAFLPHIAIAGVALGGLALAIDLATREERKRVKQAQDSAKAVTLTTDKKQSLADFFGTSLSSKYFQPAKINAKMTNQEAAAVQELKLSEAFKKQYETTITALKEGTNEQVGLILKSISLGLSADFAPDQIAVIVQALKEEAGKTRLKIDFSEVDVTTKAGRKNAIDLVKKSVEPLASTGDTKNINAETSNLDRLRRERDRALGQGATKNTLVSSGGKNISFEQLEKDIKRAEERVSGFIKPETKANIERTVGDMTSTLTALRVAYDNGQISQSEYAASVDDLREVYKNIEPYQKEYASGKMFDIFPYPPDVKKSMSSITDAALQFDLYTLSISNSSKALEIFNKYQDLVSGTSGIKSPDRLEAAIAKLKKDLKDLLGLKTEDPNGGKPLTAIQKKYEAINKLLSNYETGLSIIAEKEDVINKKYDDRLDALDKVQKANEQIAQQQQDQLDIADAITRGDVAGAARAVQQARQNSNAAAFDSQREAIDAAKLNELAMVKDPSNRTRTQLEKLINDEEMKKLLLEFWNPEEVKANGGYIRGRGTGTSDSIPAMLSNGEYVIRAKAAQALGVDTLNKMNHAEKFMMGGPVNVAKYAMGGLVGRYANGGYASSDERRSSLNSGKKKKPKFKFDRSKMYSGTGKAIGEQNAASLNRIISGKQEIGDLIAQGIPGIGIPLSAAASYGSFSRGDWGMGILDMLGAIPGLGAIIGSGSKALKLGKFAGLGKKGTGSTKNSPSFVDFDWNAPTSGSVPDILGGAGLTPLDKMRVAMTSKLLKPASNFGKSAFGKTTGLMGQIMGSAKSGLSKIPNIFKAGASKISSNVDMSPIIKGIFQKTGVTEGVTSAGTTTVNGAEYFLKKLGPNAKLENIKHLTASMNPNTGLQEYLLSNVLRDVGMNVPDLKFFPGMSNIQEGLVLGSKRLPGLDVMRNYEETMKIMMRQDPEAYKKLLAAFLSEGADTYAANDAVVNAILRNPDVHQGNLMFDAISGKVSSLDFGILNSANDPSSLFNLLNEASSSARSMRSTLFNNAMPTNPEARMKLLSEANIPHIINDVPFGVPGSDKFATLLEKTVDAKPMAEKLAKAFGFDLYQPQLPADFASKNPILVKAMEALRSSNMDPNLLNLLDPQSQQSLLENVFQNIRQIINAKDATFKYANGGMVGHYGMGGMVKPKYFNAGGLARGADVIPAMLTPGEFVVSQPGVKNFGVDNLKAINNGTRGNDSVYNYSVNLNVNGSNANAEDIARAVSRQIDRVNSQRIRGTRV